MFNRPRCPICGDELSFIIDMDRDTGEVLIYVECEYCGEYEGFTINTHMTQEDFNKFKTKILKKPKKHIVSLIQE